MTARCAYAEGWKRCTAEAIDPEAEVLLCERHAGMALRWLRQRLGNALGTEKGERR